MNDRRSFLKQFALMGGIGAAGSVPVRAAVHWLRTTAPVENGEILSMEPSPDSGVFSPLDRITLHSPKAGKIMLFDGKDRLYLEKAIGGTLEIILGGHLGSQLLLLIDGEDRILDYLAFRLEAETSIRDASGKYRQLLDNLYYTMIDEWQREGGVVRYHGQFYHHFVGWLRDHVHTMKGMKYFYPELRTGIDLYADSQREDGMIWDNYNKRPQEGDYWEQRFDYADFVKIVDEGLQEFRRIPVENDVEYLFIEGLYFTWKATADTGWMKSRLDHALKALEYTTGSPYRWSEQYGLLKRGYTIDTWDFQNDEDADISTGPDQTADPMVIKLPYTRFGIMFGDNTGMAASCAYLAEMLEVAGRNEEASRVKETGEEIRQRLDTLAWNGAYYRHQVPEDSNIIRDLGVDESKQVSLSNAYSLNRGIRHDQAVSIINTYLRLREEMPRSSPGEWYTIYPPFGKGFGGHNTKWSYMNGGVTSIVAGELAHGAFEHGFEDYGVDILGRVLELSRETGGYLHCTYRGAMEPPPEREFSPVSLKALANADIRGDTPEGVPGWTGEGDNDLHEFPTGRQVFFDIPFDIVDPGPSGGKICLGLSGDGPYAREASLPLRARARSLYFLHASNKSYYAGAIHLEYSDGTSVVDHVGPGKIANWWYPSESQDRKQMPRMRVAWRGKNAQSRNVGVCLYGLDNPHPGKEISAIRFVSAGDSAKWMVLGVTLSSHPVFFMPDKISAGIPDNWGAAALVYALLEGLCGVKDRGIGFSDLVLSPRWTVAGEREARVTVVYPASGGYASYTYTHEGDRVLIRFTGSQERSEIRLLLPGGVRQGKVSLNGKKTESVIMSVENSIYLVVKNIGPGVNLLEVEL